MKPVGNPVGELSISRRVPSISSGNLYAVPVSSSSPDDTGILYSKERSGHAAGDPTSGQVATTCGLVLTAVLIENVVDLLLDSLMFVLTLGTALALVDKGVNMHVVDNRLD